MSVGIGQTIEMTKPKFETLAELQNELRSYGDYPVIAFIEKSSNGQLFRIIPVTHTHLYRGAWFTDPSAGACYDWCCENNVRVVDKESVCMFCKFKQGIKCTHPQNSGYANVYNATNACKYWQNDYKITYQYYCEAVARCCSTENINKLDTMSRAAWEELTFDQHLAALNTLERKRVEWQRKQ